MNERWTVFQITKTSPVRLVQLARPRDEVDEWEPLQTLKQNSSKISSLCSWGIISKKEPFAEGGCGGWGQIQVKQPIKSNLNESEEAVKLSAHQCIWPHFSLCSMYSMQIVLLCLCRVLFSAAKSLCGSDPQCVIRTQNILLTTLCFTWVACREQENSVGLESAAIMFLLLTISIFEPWNAHMLRIMANTF